MLKFAHASCHDNSKNQSNRIKESKEKVYTSNAMPNAKRKNTKKTKRLKADAES